MRESRARAPRRRASGAQRSAPYEREVRAGQHADVQRSVSIKGASGPTWVVVANLVKGTSLEDVRLTFDPIGHVVEVRGYRLPNLASNAVAFQVAFEQRSDALAACRKFDGVLADGRVLQVTMQGSEPAPKVVMPPPAKVVKAAPVAQAKAGADVPPTARSNDASLPIAVRRRLAEAEARYLKETEKILASKGQPEAKPTKSTSLKDRLSSLPLAQRLQMEGSATTKKPKKKQRRKGASGAMDVDS